MLLHAFEGTMRTTAMIMAIIVAAYFLNFVITSIGLTGQVNRFITELGLTPIAAARSPSSSSISFSACSWRRCR